jgi:glyoxylase-like metal-dependent hydrolase (beta-lactamase superfamily II)
MSRFGNVRGSARREEWGTAVEVDDGLFRIRLNNPVGALMVNTYAYRSPTQLVVFDPGWPWTLQALEVALRDLGLGASLIDVDAWLYTHTHIDHMGAAGLLSEFSDAPHYTWREVEPFLDEWHSFQNRMNDWTEWASSTFEDPEAIADLEASTRRRREGGVEFLLEAHGERAVHNVELLEFGEEFRVADLELQFVDARGHDPYHGAFWVPDRGWLFAGDVVIATPTPISRPMEDDLGLYLDALERLASLDASLLLPGHGVQRSGDLSGPFERSRDYQERVRMAVLGALEQSEPAGLLELARRTTRDGEPLTPRSRWMVHIALVDTHLHALVDEGLAERHEGPRFSLQ